MTLLVGPIIYTFMISAMIAFAVLSCLFA